MCEASERRRRRKRSDAIVGTKALLFSYERRRLEGCLVESKIKERRGRREERGEKRTMEGGGGGKGADRGKGKRSTLVADDDDSVSYLAHGSVF